MSWTITNQSKTGQTQYNIANYNTSLLTTTNALLDSITQQTVGATGPPTTFLGVPSTTSGEGIGATFDVTIGVNPPGEVTGLTVNNPGAGYAVGNTITIANIHIGGGGIDLVITLKSDDFGTTNIGGMIVPDNTTLDSASIDISGYIAGTISFSISPTPTGLSTGADALGPSVTSGITDAGITTTVSGLSQSSTSGSGSGAVFTLVTDVTMVITNLLGSVTATTSGSGYAIGDTITFLEADLITAGLGGGTTGNLIITLQADDLWAAGSTLEIQILGSIDVNNFVTSTLLITQASPPTILTLYNDWNIPLEKVAIRVNNNAPSVPPGSTGTGQTITVSNIYLMTNSHGGGLGYVGTSGVIAGPGGVIPEIQFKDGGVFGGASGALYDKAANAATGQIQLAAGSEGDPMLAFSDGTHPSGTHNTGMYRAGSNKIGFSCSGAATLGFLNADSGDFTKGLNVGTTGNVGGIKRLSATAANSWEDGNCGNSEFLFISPAEFFPHEAVATVRPIAVTMLIRSTAGSRPLGVAATQPTDIDYVACKLIPKGFKIETTDDGGEVTVWCAFGLTNPNVARFGLVTQTLNPTGDSTGVILITPGSGTFTALPVIPSVLTSNTSDLFPPSVTVIGDGNTFVSLIFQPNTILDNTLGGGSTGTMKGLMGASIKISRV